MKVIYFDTETTGTNPEKHDIIQLAGMIVIDGKERETFDIRIRPINMDTVEQSALDVNGVTREMLETYQEPRVAYMKIIDMFSEHINKFNRNDKLIPIGYNIRFDLDFMWQFFKKNNDNYFGSWVSSQYIDPLPMLYWLSYLGKIKLDNYKLSTVCAYFGIELNAHEAMSDIVATREVCNKVFKMLKEL